MARLLSHGKNTSGDFRGSERLYCILGKETLFINTSHVSRSTGNPMARKSRSFDIWRKAGLDVRDLAIPMGYHVFMLSGGGNPSGFPRSTEVSCAFYLKTFGRLG
ncbi:Hypothetical protein NTJ_14072 [Nesidiocoris tenuis]|uniref:Uncharacterized protein n=1 Tax=Nesidiocoris tenuis TaxID=355587 RepID=A0ABN7BA50_9HEMI|nr:Hypothetical protein NTJ_14072 [Nesidiocoris tenuis]